MNTNLSKNIIKTMLGTLSTLCLGGMLPSLAYADAASAAKQNSISQFIILGLFFGFLYFMIIRPQSKRAKEHKALIDNIAKDDEVITSGGLIGKITKISDHYAKLMIAEGVEVSIQKGMIVGVLPKGTMKGL